MSSPDFNWKNLHVSAVDALWNVIGGDVQIPREKSEDDRDTLIAYLEMKVRSEDWHAVADAAMDLRELDARSGGFNDGYAVCENEHERVRKETPSSPFTKLEILLPGEPALKSGAPLTTNPLGIDPTDRVVVTSSD